MADITLTARPILGVDLELGPNRITERSDLALVSIAVPLGSGDALPKALKKAWKIDPPEPRMTTAAGEVRAIRTAQDQMMLVFPHETPDAERVVQEKLGGAGYTTDQTDVWVVLEISGPDTAAALERLCLLDLHPDAFPDGASARTVMEHMGAMIVRLGPERYWLMSASSSAGSFMHAVETSFVYVM